MRNLRSLPLCALSLALYCNFAMAQTVAPTVRILKQIDPSHLVPLKGNVNPLANANNDRGSVGADLAMSGLTLILSRSPEQQAAFDSFVEDQYDPGSPSFHQWLTPSQIGERFGPAQADIATISTWLANQGFAVTSVSPDRMTINFSGTAGQVQGAFHTAIHNLSVNGVPHIANMTDPQIPEALSDVVVGVKGLHNFRPHPLHRVSGKVQISSNGSVLQRLVDSPAASLVSGGVPVSEAAAPPSVTLRPTFTYTPANSSIPVEDVAPYDFATIYNVLPLWQKATPINGTGQIITVIGTSDINVSDVATFKSIFGLPAGLTPIMAHPTTDPGVCTSATNACGIGDLQENTLDVEWSGAVAPGAQVVLVTSPYNNQTNPTNDPIFDSAQWTVSNVNKSGTAVYNSHILSVSYGLCELAMGTAANVAYRNLWQTAASAGIAVIVASGDAGAPACDQGGDASGTPYSAQYGLSVSGLASTPYNTAVGGTQFTWCLPAYNSSGKLTGCSASTAAPYWSTTNNGTNRSNALGYIPERPWNDSCIDPIWTAYLTSIAPFFNFGTPANPEAACNYVYNNWLAINQAEVNSGNGQLVLAPFVDTVGAGGGASNCIVNDNQNANSCSASTTSTGSSYGSLPLVNDGWPQPSWQTGVSGIPSGGSRAIPDVSFFAGDGALQSATLVCAAQAGGACSASNLSGTALEVGGTSIGAPQMAGVMALINQSTGSPQGNPNAQLYQLASKQNYAGCSSEGGSVGSNCYFNDVDQGTITMPCAVSTQTVEGGAVYNSGSGLYNVNGPTAAALASPNCAALNSGDKVGTLVSSGTTPGYNAGAGFDLATGLGSMNIANVVTAWTGTSLIGTTPSTVTVTPASNTVESDLPLSVPVTVSGSSGTPVGSVSLSAGNYSGSGVLSSGAYTFTVPAGSFTSGGTQTISATYNGDSTYAVSTGSASVTVNYVNFTLGAIGNPSAIARGSNATASATIASTNGYKGTVTVSCILTSGPTTNYAPTCIAGNAVTLSSSAASLPVNLTVSTTAATAAVTYPKMGNGKGWLGAGSGAILAILVFLGIPARRRSWQTMLGLVVLVASLSAVSGCVAKSSSTSTSSTATPGTASGAYTFTVTASGSPATAAVASQTFIVTVN
jgi:subtilase family serine protease